MRYWREENSKVVLHVGRHRRRAASALSLALSVKAEGCGAAIVGQGWLVPSARVARLGGGYVRQRSDEWTWRGEYIGLK